MTADASGSEGFLADLRAMWHWRTQADGHDPPDIDDRPYIAINPTETPIDPGTAITAMERLYAIQQNRWQTGVVNRVRGRVRRPKLEILIVADGRPDPTLRYLVGSPDEAFLEEFHSLLRTFLPTDYERDVIEWHPRYIEETLPLDAADDEAIPDDAPYAAGVEYVAETAWRRDWQTPLTRFDQAMATDATQGSVDDTRVPLAPIVESMVDASVPVVFQAVITPHRDWSTDADKYIKVLRDGSIGVVSGTIETISPTSPSDRAAHTPPPSMQERIDAIRPRMHTDSFVVTARAVALTKTDPKAADRAADLLSTGLRPLSGSHHQITGRVSTDAETGLVRDPRPGWSIYEDLYEVAHSHPNYHRGRSRLPRTTYTSRGIVVDARELPSFALIDGSGLSGGARRAIGARPQERTAIPLPPPAQLTGFRPPGMALCMPLTHDRQPAGEPLYLPPDRQDRHVVVVGRTGAGKSILLERAALSNADATDGPDIVFDTKGGDTSDEFLRSHYAEHGSLEDVYYFDLSKTLPALSFFDISPLLEAGVPREEARSRKASHYEAILASRMGPEQYGQAAESVKAIRNHLRALYDPDYGDDAIAHQELHDALMRTRDDEAPPTTSDDRLSAYFESLVLRHRDVFSAIMGGALGRVETIATDGRLAPLFDHVPADDGPHFDFADILDDDVTVIFDFAGLDDAVKRALTMVILSNLWTALKARNQAGDDHPLVNCYLEEARNVAETELLDTLLAEGRAFGLSLTLGLQYPEQVATPDPDRDTYHELLNETATVVAGPVAVEGDLSRVLATDDMPPDEVANRLRALARGEWLVRPAAGFGDDAVRPFLATSLDPPAGHPASDEPIGETRFADALERCTATTARWAGIDHSAGPDDDGEWVAPDVRLDSLLPHTDMRPDGVAYKAGPHALECESCGHRDPPTIEGMRNTINCCGSLDDVDRDDVPPCRLELTRSVSEIEASAWSLDQLIFLQTVHNAQQRRFDSLEYDIRRDSMVRLREAVGIDHDAVEELIDAGLLYRDTDHPHRLYSLSPDGRAVIGESMRKGVDFGHGKGDLKESSEHVLGVELGKPLVEHGYAADPHSPAERVKPYYGLDPDEFDAPSEDGEGQDATYRRLDIAGLDADGEVVVAVEVERANQTVRSGAPLDYDKLTACDIDEGIWIVPTKTAGRDIIHALRDPADGEPRLSHDGPPFNTPPAAQTSETGPVSAIYTYEWLLDRFVRD